MRGQTAEVPPAADGRGGKSTFLRAVFWAVLLAVLLLSAWPHPPDLPYVPSDKVQHALTFLGLSLLGAAAYPRLPLIKLALGLAAFGALIEAVQAIPMLNRQTELLDWMADIGGTGLALAALVAWRSWRRMS